MRTPEKCFTGLITAILLLFTVVLSAQDLPESESPAVLAPTTTVEFEDYTHDFGTVLDGTRVTQVFTFTNTGDEPFILMNAHGSCGCTVPQWPRERIMPGETASIVVEFNSKNKRGKRKQKVTLTANTNPPQTFLYLTGEVTPEDGSEPIAIEQEADTKLSKDCFAIFPNPTSEVLKLNVEEEHLGQSAAISIYGESGQVMAKREIAVIEGTIEFNVAHYPAGTYIAQVQIGDQRPEARCFVVVD